MLTPVQIAAVYGWCKWPEPRAIREENERALKEMSDQTDWLFTEATPEQREAVLRREAGIARDEAGNFITVAVGSLHAD